jgi:hypothetical protein
MTQDELFRLRGEYVTREAELREKRDVFETELAALRGFVNGLDFSRVETIDVGLQLARLQRIQSLASDSAALKRRLSELKPQAAL